MGVIDDHVKEYLNVKLKNRQDDFTDQVSRIIVTKLLVVFSLILGLVWFKDETNCITHPESDTQIPEKFLHNACWIKGFYIYPHLSQHMDQSAYYGIPLELENDGHRDDDSAILCSTKKKSRDKSTCVPMVKQYYTQYQWMPFYLFSLAFLFHYPYILFRLSNTDMASLRINLRNHQVSSNNFERLFLES